MKFNQEGFPFIAGATACAVLAYIINTAFGFVATALALFVLYFFRDPDRVLPDEENVVVSPADGIVIDISEDEMMNEKSMRISIFLRIWDVHVTRIPYGGKIVQKSYKKGTFAHAETDKALNRNESLAIKIESKVSLVVRQVAGLLGRRIVCYVENGDNVRLGERYGIIKFGSRMDIYLPTDAQILVKKGQTMVGGETILAKVE